MNKPRRSAPDDGHQWPSMADFFFFGFVLIIKKKRINQGRDLIGPRARALVRPGAVSAISRRPRQKDDNHNNSNNNNNSNNINKTTIQSEDEELCNGIK